MINWIEKPHLADKIRRQGHDAWKVDGIWVTTDDTAVQAIIDAFDPLPYARSEAKAAIDAAAEAARLRYITPGSGQAATYQLKEQQARQYQADGTVGVMLQLEAQATGASVADTAALIVATADQWIGLAALIEAKRMGAKMAVNAEPDWQACAAIAQAAVAELDAL